MSNPEFDRALAEIAAGRPVLVYDFDDREKETDFTIASQFVTPSILKTMRKEAGGLICTTMPGVLARDIGLPFLSDVFKESSMKFPLLAAMSPDDIPYDPSKSSFGITLNHRDTYTGITDNDRALTITSFVDSIFRDSPVEKIREELGSHFRAPGHVHLLNTTDSILETRKGHTELCTALMYMAGVKPSATICEMMGEDGGSMTRPDVERFSVETGIPMVTGEDVLENWAKFKDGGLRRYGPRHGIRRLRSDSSRSRLLFGAGQILRR